MLSVSVNILTMSVAPHLGGLPGTLKFLRARTGIYGPYRRLRPRWRPGQGSGPQWEVGGATRYR